MTRCPVDHLTVLIPYRNGAASIERLLDSLPAELCCLVVDDCSDPPFRTERPNVRVLRLPERGYFSGAVNAGMAAIGSDDALVLNQDVWLEGTAWLQLLEQHRAEYGIIGDGVMNHPAWRNGYVQGTFMFLRRAAWEQVGELNARDYPLWGATCEWQLRACRAGWKAWASQLFAKTGLHHGRGDAAYGSAISELLTEEPERRALWLRTPPAISVIITSYNYGRYVPDALNSLLGGETSLGTFPPQTFPSFEVVLVNDGSTDNSAQIMGDRADAWKGVLLVQRERKGGSGAAANSGIAVARGKYVTVLDADDMMEPTRLERLYRAAEAHPHRVIYDDPMLFKAGKRTERMPLAKEYDFEKLLTHNQMHKGILMPRRAWEEVGGYPEEMKYGREDWGINVALGAHGYCGVHLDEPLYLYRRDGQNRTLTNNTAEWRNYFVDQMHRLYPSLYAGERPMGCCGSGARTVKLNGNGASLAQVRGRMAGAMANIPGQSGFAQVEYLLPRAGTQQYRGAVTGTTYVFGGQRRIGYVDPRDLDGLLALFENGRQAFRKYIKTETIVIQKAPESESVAAPGAGAAPKPSSAQTVAAQDFTPEPDRPARPPRRASGGTKKAT